MLKTLTATAAAAFILGATPAAAEAPTPETHTLVAPTCNGEAGPEFGRCAWDARHEGNRHGMSYVGTRHGSVYKVPHWVAHRLRGF